MVNEKSKKSTTSTSNSKKQLALRIVGCALVLLIGWFLYDEHMAQPLGNDGRIVYIGKTRADLYIPFISWSHNSDVFYYGTDMTPEEMTAYFTKATRTDKIYNDERVSAFTLRLSDGSTLDIDLYKDKQHNTIPERYQSTPKKYIFEISAPNYRALEKSLGDQIVKLKSHRNSGRSFYGMNLRPVN